MSNTSFLTVKVSMICEKTVEVEVIVPIESLSKDNEGLYSFDEIQDKAKSLAEVAINSCHDFDHMILDSAHVIHTPDDFEYWS